MKTSLPLTCSYPPRYALGASTRSFPLPRNPTPCSRRKTTVQASANRVTAAAVIDRPATKDVVQPGQEVQTPSQEPFSWTKQWWAVSLLEATHRDRPNVIELLGQTLVLWHTAADDTWSCLDDRCPHRQAPLSEGRIENGTLQCPYHGWRFAPSGQCLEVPAAETPEANARATASPRSCAVSYPTQVAQGLIYVWPEAGPQAALQAACTRPHLLPWVDEQDVTRTPEGTRIVPIFKGIQRDMPISYEHQMENLCDPAHFNFVHSGVAADRTDKDAGVARLDPVPEHETVPAMFNGAEGTARRVQMKMGLGRTLGSQIHSIVMPQLFTIYTPAPKDFPGAEWECLNIYCVPTKPGHVRLIVRNWLASDKPPLAIQLVNLFPQWFHDIQGMEVTDGDLVLLNKQDQYTREGMKRTDKSWLQQYYMPTEADSLIVETRKWLDTRGSGGPFPGAEAQPSMPHEAVVDRYQQHSKDCPSCSVAIKRLHAGRIAFAALATILAASALTTAITTALRSVAPLWLVAGSVVAGAAAAVCHKFWRQLTFVGFHHYEHK